MKPSIGRIVVVKGALTSNGTDEHPAIVNRVWGNGEPALGEAVCINTTMFPDCGEKMAVTSVYMFETRKTAEEWLAEQKKHGCNPAVAFWPDRV